MKFSEKQFAHPLALEASSAGFRVFYPGNSITANEHAIFGGMPGGKSDDFILGHDGQQEFPDARVDDFSDWFVTLRFAAGEKKLAVSYGHGSPFVYALVENGNVRISTQKPAQVWSGNAKNAVLGVTINGKAYGFFGPSGCEWSGLEGTSLVCNMKAKNYFSAALLQPPCC